MASRPIKSNLPLLQAIVFSTSLLLLSGCGEIYRYAKSGEVGWALKTELRDKRRKEVDMTKLAKFKWDELFTFDPYTPMIDVCKRLALSEDDCRQHIKAESDDDGVMLIVFRKNGKIVHSEMHFLWHGDFTPVPANPFTSSTSVFSVLVKDQSSLLPDRLMLRPKFDAAL